MKVTVKQTKDYEKEMEISLTPDEVNPEFEKGFREYRGKVRVDGFRKGMVPIPVIKKMYGPAIKAEYIDKIIDKFYKEALIQEQIMPLNQGSIEDIDMTQEGALTFTAKFEVTPKIEAPDISDLKLTKTIRTVKDEDVEEQLKRIQQSQATRKVVDGPVQDGNFIMFDIQMADPKTKAPLIGQKYEDRYLLVGHDEEYKEFSQKVIGMNKGEERFIAQEMPANVFGIETSEKIEAYTVTIKDVGAVELPELNDEFAKKVNEEFQSLDDLRDRLRKQMEKENTLLSEQEIMNGIRDELVKRLDVEPPPSLVDNFLQMGKERYKSVAGKGFDEKVAEEHLKPEAHTSAKYYIIKQSLIREKESNVSEEEIEKRIEEIAEEQNVNLERLKRVYKGERERSNIRSDVFERKINDMLKNMITIEEKTE